MHELHPCGILLAEFKNAFLFGNRQLLFVECRNPSADSTPLISSAPDSHTTKPEDGLVAKEVSQAELKVEAQRCIKELKIFMSILYSTLEAFYGIDSLLKQSRLSREQLENYCTSLVLDDVVYIYMYNLITLAQLDQVQKLESILKTQRVDLASLPVKEVFHLTGQQRRMV